MNEHRANAFADSPDMLPLPARVKLHPLQSYQQRTLEERNELEVKIAELNEFIHGSPDFKEAPIADQTLMRDQLNWMLGYYRILNLRINKFPVVTTRI